MKTDTHRIIRLILIGVIIISLGALAWWYLYLSRTRAALSATSEARGFTTETPTGSPLGSTYQNIVSTVLGTIGAHVATSTEAQIPQLRRVSAVPVAGYGWVGKGDSAALWFVERGTGYVLSIDPQAQSAIRLSGTLRPKIYEAAIGSRGSVVERSWEDGHIVTFLGSIVAASSSPGSSPASSTPKLTGEVLEPDITSVAWSPDGATLAYVIATSSGSLVRTIATSSKPRTIYESGIAGWAVAWAQVPIIVERAASGVMGHAYAVSGGALRAYVRPTPGLTLSIPHSGSGSLVGSDTGRSLALSLRAGTSTNETPIPLHTFADKCAWSPDSRVFCAVPQGTLGTDALDRWYRGELHTDDAWYVINTRTNTYKELPTDRQGALDVTHPVIDDTGTYLAFQNAEDGSLWLMHLSATSTQAE